jgi:hypothetical protein
MKPLRNFRDEGITYNKATNSFAFKNTADATVEVIKLVDIPLTQVHLGNLEDVYYFGYSFEESAPSRVRTEFFNQFRFDQKFTSEENRNSFILSALDRFHREIKLSTFDCVVYPKSRSSLNQELIKAMTRNYRLNVTEFELLKKLPADIQFDYDRFEVEILNSISIVGKQSIPNYTPAQKIDSKMKIEKVLDAIHHSDYFSIANSVKNNKYKPYFNQFLTFATEKEERLYQNLQNKNVLIVDDVSTTGSTIYEILKTLRSLNSTNKIVIFTVIGKKQLL